MKRTLKITKAQQIEFEQGWRNRNKWLKELGLPKQTYEQYLEWLHGRGKKEKKSKTGSYTTPITFNRTTEMGRKTSENPTVDVRQEARESVNEDVLLAQRHWTKGPCSSKPSPVYTGTKIIGIGTMHKSNMVPIFNDQEAKDISSMRR